MKSDISKIKQQALEQLSEKQAEEMDRMQAKRLGLPLSTHTDPNIQASVFSDLLSGIPVQQEDNTEQSE